MDGRTDGASVLPVLEREEWEGDSACRDHDVDLFFPVGTTGRAVPQIAAARAVCGDCPVRLECLEFAVMTNQEYGVWGGATEEERRRIRRELAREGVVLPRMSRRRAASVVD